MEFRIEEYRPTNVVLHKNKMDIFVVVGNNCSCLENYGNVFIDESEKAAKRIEFMNKIFRNDITIDIKESFMFSTYDIGCDSGPINNSMTEEIRKRLKK